MATVDIDPFRSWNKFNKVAKKDPTRLHCEKSVKSLWKKKISVATIALKIGTYQVILKFSS